MKTVLSIIMIFSFQYANSQSCGTYRIEYVGEIKSEITEELSIIFPSIETLHGIKSNNKTYEVEINNKKFEHEITSNLTSNIFETPEQYLQLFKQSNRSLSIIINKNNGTQKKTIEIPWDKVEITKGKDKKFGNLFQINLKEIILTD